MKQYLVPFLVYLLTLPIVNQIFRDRYLAYTITVFLTIASISLYYKHYVIKPRFDIKSILTGVAIFIIWVGTDNLYPHLSYSSFVPTTWFILVIRLISLVMIAPLIEEIFVRKFLIRFIINRDFEKVPIGKYTLFSFLITTLFFGFSHRRWLPGLITGALLNLLLYSKKDVSHCVVAHFTANLLLALYIVLTGSWFFW